MVEVAAGFQQTGEWAAVVWCSECQSEWCECPEVEEVDGGLPAAA